jgi:hypothetical protein
MDSYKRDKNNLTPNQHYQITGWYYFAYLEAVGKLLLKD